MVLSLLELCYIEMEYFHTLEGMENADETIYNNCVEFINSPSDCFGEIRETLEKYFANDLK